MVVSQKAHILGQHPNPITTMSLSKYLLNISTNELEGPFTYDFSLFSKYTNFMSNIKIFLSEYETWGSLNLSFHAMVTYVCVT